MRHYEIVYMVHPNRSDQAAAMSERYRGMIEAAGGVVHRFEDWGRRVLAYPVNQVHKAHYMLMNIECDTESLRELTEAFRFNDSVIRSLVIRCKSAVTEPSPLADSKQEMENAEEEAAQEVAAELNLMQDDIDSEEMIREVADDEFIAAETMTDEQVPPEPGADAEVSAGENETADDADDERGGGS